MTKLSRWSILYKETIVPASMTPAREFVLFQTELFSFEQPDDQVSHWWIGGDCAGWFYARLLPLPEVNRYCDLVMEDWGWTFGVLVDGVQVWVKLWEYFPIQKCWLIGLESKRRLFQRSTAEVLAAKRRRIADAIEQIICQTPGIIHHEWFSENPFETEVDHFTQC